MTMIIAGFLITVLLCCLFWGTMLRDMLRNPEVAATRPYWLAAFIILAAPTTVCYYYLYFRRRMMRVRRGRVGL